MRISRNTVENVFEVVPDRCTDQEVCFICPSCLPGSPDRTGNRSVNLISGRTNCWRCNKGGDFVKWAAGLGIVIEAEEFQVSEDSVVTELNNALTKTVKKAVYAIEVELPQGFSPLEEHSCTFAAKRIARMAARKRLTMQDFIDAGVGHTEDNRDWDAYAIFPVTEWGKVVYYQGRTYDDPDYGSTKKFPSRAICPYGSRNWVYGIDEARYAHTVVVVESILNVLSLRKELAVRGIEKVAPVAIFKHKISTEQAIKLAGLRHATEVCLMFDSDAIADAYAALGTNSLPAGIKRSVVEMPTKVDANDDAVMAVNLWQKRKTVSKDHARVRMLENMLRA